MYWHHALISVLNVHVIHILNTILYADVEHSTTKTTDVKYYKVKTNKQAKHRKKNRINSNIYDTELYA